MDARKRKEARGRYRPRASRAIQRPCLKALDLRVVAPAAAWYGADVIPFVTLGYRFFGDPTFTDDLGDFTVDLENGFTASAGLTIPVGSQSTFTMAYDYLQTSVAGVQDVHELYGAVNVPIVENWSVSAYSVAGLTDASPDFAVGLSLRWRFSD